MKDRRSEKRIFARRQWAQYLLFFVFFSQSIDYMCLNFESTINYT
eukprot:UN18668